MQLPMPASTLHIHPQIVDVTSDMGLIHYSAGDAGKAYWLDIETKSVLHSNSHWAIENDVNFAGKDFLVCQTLCCI